MKNHTKHTIIGIAFVLSIILLARFSLADIPQDAPAAGGPALSLSQLTPAQVTQLQNTDSDLDGISDYDEIYVYGTNPYRESTSGDAYDDGQKILGYSDPSKGQLGGQMPAYVKWPATSPFVAAYPQIDFTIDSNYRLVLNQDIQFGNRTSQKFDRTFGTIVTMSISNSHGVGDSHTVGGHTEIENSETDSNLAAHWQNNLTSQSTLSSQATEYSKINESGWYMEGVVGVHDGIRATVDPGYMSIKKATDKTIKSDIVVTNFSMQNGNVVAGGKTITTSQNSGTFESSTGTATTEQAVTTSVSNVNLYTVGTAQEWETSTTQNTVDASRLYFTFHIKNSGTTRTSGISNLRFTVKIGNYTITYPSLDKTGISLPALNPGEEHVYSDSNGISLDLDELKEFDTKGDLKIFVEDYDLGNSNEETYALNAYAGGTLFIIDDGSKDDGSNLQYYLTHVEPGDTYGNILLRLNKSVPVGSAQNLQKVLDASIANGTITSLAGLPVTDNAAWFIQSEGISNQSFLFKPAKQGSKVIFTYSKDSDNDGYPDRAERKAGTNPNDANSHPNPNVVTGYYVESVSLTVDNVTLEKTKPVFTLKSKVVNTGNYDAYGAEIRMLSTNSDIDVVDNFAGGSVRIKPNETFVVNDSLIWKPSSSGVQEASSFFSKQNIGVTILELPEAEVLYKARGLIGSGIQAFYSISASLDGNAWTAVGNVGWTQASNGWDEFVFQFPVYAKYIKIEGQGRIWDSQTHSTGAPFALANFELYRYEYNGKGASQLKPILETLYNDPQGPHRFVSNLRIANENASIAESANEMKRGLDLAISAPQSLTYGGASSIGVDFSNPNNASFDGGRIFVKYQTINGTTLKTFGQPATLASGSTHFNFNFNTADFGNGIIGSEVVVLAVAFDSRGNAIAEEIETVSIENPIKILNYYPGDVPDVIKLNRTQVQDFAIYAAATSQLSYNWLLNGQHVPGADSNKYTYQPLTTGNQIITVQISDGTYTNSHAWKIEATSVVVIQPPQNNSSTSNNTTIITPPVNNTTIINPPKPPVTVSPGSSSGGGAGGGAEGSDSLKCNIGYELKNGKCVLKNSESARVDGKNTTANETAPEKPRINVGSQDSAQSGQSAKGQDDKVTGFLTAVTGKGALLGFAIIALLFGGYYVFTRKYRLKVDFERNA